MFSKCDWWIHLGYMLRLHSRCTPNVIGGYIGEKVIQSLQFTQDVPTGFQGTSPPVMVCIIVLSLLYPRPYVNSEDPYEDARSTHAFINFTDPYVSERGL